MKPLSLSKPRVRIFVSYSHEDTYWMQRLRSVIQFSGIAIDFWSDQKIPTGLPWYDQITHELAVMDIFIALVSVHFAASKFIQEVECPIAKERHKLGEIEIVPIYVAPTGGDECSWLMKLQRVPNEKSWMETLKEFPQYDLTLPQIRQAIGQVIDRVRTSSHKHPTKGKSSRTK